MNRLSKILAKSGLAARRKCEEIIFQGRVSVNGQIVLLPQTFVDPEKDKILVDKHPIRLEKKRYYLLNKPKGYVCSPILGGKPYKMATDLIPKQNRLFMVGRLDKDTTGLLLITNDGHFANQVIHPSFGLDKEYLVKVANFIGEEELKRLSKGIWIEGKFVKPKRVIKVRKGTLKIIVTEGKKREIRRMVKAAKLDLKELTRIRIGPLHLGSLPLGAYRELSLNEINALIEAGTKLPA